ncbi:hypothetical protein [Aureimonas sp. SA4125]|uniref:hypothetical protein n=1 Tax=Aureimonas sp. SA4125 TaxID=2826993 RepID=UPI001CC4DE6F|nr:hypothetical protein [Aureimonas sp. SA4125]
MTSVAISQASLPRQHVKGILRSAFDRLIEARHLQARRYISNVSSQGIGRLDLADINRRSLFEAAAPERN